MSESQVLERWVAPGYLSADRVRALAESAAAKPDAHYLVLDDFFVAEAADLLRQHLLTLEYSEDLDRQVGGDRLPYDSAVKFAGPSDVGWELFEAPAWHAYCAALVGATLHDRRHSIVKLRRHRADATGFWIHSDAIAGERSLVVVAYFNPGWSREDGGLLQLWREGDPTPHAARVISAPDPDKPLDVLTTESRIRTAAAGARVAPRRVREFVLVDEVVPEHNRLFVCNIQDHPAWHAVTPSRGRVRYGFVQWIG
jgi:hypothetical protein